MTTPDQEILWRFLSGELSEKEQRELQKTLGNSPQVRLQLEDIAQTKGLFATNVSTTDSQKFARDVVTQIQKNHASEAAGINSWFQEWLIPTCSYVCASLLLLYFYQTNSTTITVGTLLSAQYTENSFEKELLSSSPDTLGMVQAEWSEL